MKRVKTNENSSRWDESPSSGLERRTVRISAYIICELDGTVFHRPVAAFRLLPYFPRQSIPIPDDLIDIDMSRLCELKTISDQDSESFDEPSEELPDSADIWYTNTRDSSKTLIFTKKKKKDNFISLRLRSFFYLTCNSLDFHCDFLSWLPTLLQFYC
jgi:hypothetical protein